MIELKREDISLLYGNKIWMMPDSGSAEPNSSPSESANSPAEEISPKVEEKAPLQVKEAVKPTPEASPAVPSSPAEAPLKEALLPVRWGLKPESQVIFIMSLAEKADKELTGLLQKIVESLEIPKEKAGFGFIDGDNGQPDISGLPGSFAIVFGKEFARGEGNPVQFEGKPVFFAHSLKALSTNREFKLELWNYMKSIKSKIH